MKIEKIVNRIEPLVSVVVITYNHKDFIEKCLDSILIQKTNFPFEIILGEDNSSDGTREICRSYAEKYPKKIRLFLRHSKDKIFINGNKTGRFNLIECYKESRGKYIAICEGDDYWTDPLKLQKQIDFLQENEDYSTVFHNAKIHNSITNQEHLHHNWDKSKEIKIQEVISFGGYVYPTCSLVFRNFKSIQKDLNSKAAGDLILAFELIKNGQMYYMSDAMSVYRRHDAGIYSGILKNKKALSENLNDQLDFYILQRREFSSEYANSFDEVINKLLKRLLVEFKVPIWQLAKYYPIIGFKDTLKLLYARIRN